PQCATHFSDGTGLVSRSGPLAEPRRAMCALLKTCNQLKENRDFPQALCRLASVKPFGCHAIRHLTASILAKNNTPMVAIQAILRHRKLATTERYVRGLEPVRPYLRVLEGGLSGQRSTDRSTTNEKGLRVVTS